MAGQTIDKDGIALTSTPLQRKTTNEFTGPMLCSTVTIKNASDAQFDVSPYRWKLQDPSGIARSTSIFTDNELEYGELAPGGHTQGAVCFDKAPARLTGQYVLLYDGSILSGERRAWVNTFR